MDLAPLRRRRERLIGRARDGVRRVLDAVPGSQRLVDDLVRIELIDRCMVIAAQALLALVPLLIVLTAYLPPELTAAVLDRLEVVTGSAGATADALAAPVTTDQVRSETGVVGLALTVFSATSFARAVQRTYERVWGLPHVGGMRGVQHCLTWLVGWLVLLELTALLSSWLGILEVLRLCVQLLGTTLVWWWTTHALLLGRESWSRLLPGAVVTGVALVSYVAASEVVMPRYAETSAAQLGSLGVVLAATSWLIGFAFVVVVAAVVGRVLTEEPRLRRLVVPLARAVVGRPPRARQEQPQDDAGPVPPRRVT